MTRWTRLAIFLLLSSTSCAAQGQTTAPTSLFDPARHMHIAEVKPGMKGYGLGVFQGTKIERFDVEVISVLHNFNPKEDVVLIRCHGANLEHTGPIAGMSGSPIYLTDEQGKSRLIGAFAFGWSLLKDPIAGVQPIEYMLDIGTNGQANPSAPPAGMRTSSRITYVYDPFRYRTKQLTTETARDESQLHALATPLMAAGLSPRVLEQFKSILREQNLVALQAGASTGTPTSQPTRMEPGSVLGAPLVTGDISLTAIGTCTEVIGDRVFGFGHPFNNEGPISLPMGTGQVNAVIPVLSQSFKIGSITDIQGTLLADESAGVAGQFGKTPKMVPMDLRVIYTDGSLDMTYHVQTVSHARLTPVLSAMAAASALTGRRDLPNKQTLDYEFDFQFSNGRTVKMIDVATNVSESIVMRQLMSVLDFVGDNPFEKVSVEKITATMRVTPEAREAEILSASLNKTKFRPGETMQIFVRCRPYRGEEKIIPIEIELGHDLRDGKYQITINDPETYIHEEQTQRPFRFTTESIGDVFDVLNEIGAIREDAMYVRLIRQPDGVAVGRTAMPNLPISRRQVLLDSGRSDVSPLVSSAAKTVITGMVMTGSADLDFEIDAGQHVEKRPPHAPRQTRGHPGRGTTRTMKTPPRSIIILILCMTTPVWAVKTSHWVHTTQADFEKGTMSRVVATNLGDLKLSRQLTTMLGPDARVSAVFAMAQAPDGTIYAGTGPEGILLAVKNDKVTTAAELGKHTTIFSLLVDSRGRLLAGTGGDKGQILRIDSPGAKPQSIFESEGVQYIWSMVQTSDGTIYAATGPKGQLFSIDANGANKVIFHSDQNNLLSMLSDGSDLLYIGTDPDGLVYRVNRKSGDVFVMYDAPQSEISALALDGHGNLFAGTSESSSAEDHTPAGEEMGRPEGSSREAPIPSQPRQNPKPPEVPGPSPGEPLPIPKTQIKTLMMLQEADPTPEPIGPTTTPMAKRAARHEAPPAEPHPKEETGNSIYRIDAQGFVTEVFHEADNVLAIASQNGTLLVGTGDDGNVYQVNPDAGETLVLAKVDSKDVMCLLPAKDGRMFMGLAGEGEIAAMSQGFAADGTFISAALDAGQISAFGKIQLRGTLPAATNLKIATRSGNVADADDPGWSKWSDDVPAAEFVQVTSVAARFLQYRLTFASDRGQTSPIVQDIDVAYQIPNQAPLIKSIKIDNGRKEDEPVKPNSKYTIKWEADDPNEDDLKFNLYFRASSRGPWILLKDKLVDPTFDWETRNVGDGRYEIRVEASDAAANPAGQGKTASRVSDPILVDNTPPVIGDIKSSVSGTSATIGLRVVDRTGTVAELQYTVDSSKDWQSVLPQDSIADSPEEVYQVVIGGLSAGGHQIALRAADAMGNRSFESVMVSIEK